MKNPKFSIIAVDYEFHVPRDGMVKGLQSLADQTFKDFELIICHDGPKHKPYSEEIDFESMGLNPIIINTEITHAQWGHPSRDKAMRIANGEYFFQFNIDNLMYPECLEKIAKHIDETKAMITIFQVRHWKAAGGAAFRGIPPVHCGIDAMQLVAHRDIWEKVGYWYDYSPTSDGIIYQKMCDENLWTELPELLGENF